MYNSIKSAMLCQKMLRGRKLNNICFLLCSSMQYLSTRHNLIQLFAERQWKLYPPLTGYSCSCLDLFLASLKLGGSCSCSRSIFRNSSMVSRLEAVSLKSPSLFLIVPSESFTTFAISFTERLKLCNLAATNSAIEQRLNTNQELVPSLIKRASHSSIPPILSNCYHYFRLCLPAPQRPAGRLP